MLVGIPQRHVAARSAVGRKVAFHHAAVRAERFDGGFNIGPPGFGELRIADRTVAQLEAETPDRHAEPTDLAEDVWTLGEFLQSSCPPSKTSAFSSAFISTPTAIPIWSRTKVRPGNDLPCRQLRQRRIEYTGVEGQAALFHLGQAEGELGCP